METASEFTVQQPDFKLIIGTLIAFGLLIALVDVLLREFKDSKQKMFWLSALVLTGGLTVPFYLLKRKDLLVK